MYRVCCYPLGDLNIILLLQNKNAINKNLISYGVNYSLVLFNVYCYGNEKHTLFVHKQKIRLTGYFSSFYYVRMRLMILYPGRKNHLKSSQGLRYGSLASKSRW